MTLSHSLYDSNVLKTLSSFPEINNALYFYFKSYASELYLKNISSDNLKNKVDFIDLLNSYSQLNRKLEIRYFKSNRVEAINEVKFRIFKIINKLSRMDNFIDISFIKNDLSTANNCFDIIKIMSTLFYFCTYNCCYDYFKDEFMAILTPMFEQKKIKIDTSYCRIYFDLMKKVNLL